MADEFIEDGFVLLSRKIFKSKTFNGLNAIQKYITIYLILKANWKDNEWWDSYQKKFITIKRGSFITSIEQIRKEIKDKSIKTQKIRTCIEILKNMQFLTSETTSHYTLITILKYDLYQAVDNYINKPNNKALTKPQQSLNKALTITNKDKKDKKEKERKLSRTFEKCEAVYQLTIYLEGKIRENNKAINKRTEPQIQSWCKDIDLLIRKDGANPKEIKQIIDWVVEDNFWSGNILSAKKLRKHYPRFYKKVITNTTHDPNRFDFINEEENIIE